MSWIESHQALERHPKTLKLTTEMGWSVDTAIGKLHRFWWWCVDYAENGDLSKYNDQVIGGGVGLTGEDSKKFVDAMITAAWIDRSPYLRVHDWWTYIGRFLQVKYKNYPEKWMEIKALYNNGKKNSPKNRFKGGFKPKLPNQPNQPNQPNLTNLTTFDVVWQKYPNRQGRKAAMRHYNATVKTPDDAANIETALENYLKSEKVKRGFVQNGSTWFNDWQSWIKPTPEMMGGNNAAKNKPTGFNRGDNTAGTVDSSKYDKAGIPD